MEYINLVNKIVKVNDLDDLQFYFPGFKVKKYVSSIDYGDAVIYTGPMNKRAQSILEGCTYVATEGLYQYDLTDRKEKIKFVFSKWEREVPNNILSVIDLYDQEEFNYCCKVYWIAGRWPYKPEHESSIYELYEASVGPVMEFIKKFYQVCEVYPIGVIEQSFFTFMLRAKYVDDQNVSPTYKRLLKTFYNTSGKNYKKAVNRYIESTLRDRNLRFVEFIYALREN